MTAARVRRGRKDRHRAVSEDVDEPQPVEPEKMPRPDRPGGAIEGRPAMRLVDFHSQRGRQPGAQPVLRLRGAAVVVDSDEAVIAQADAQAGQRHAAGKPGGARFAERGSAMLRPSLDERALVLRPQGMGE